MASKLLSKHKNLLSLSQYCNVFYSTTSLSNPQNVDSNLILFNVNDSTGYAKVELNRPPVNSLNLELLAQFNSILDDCEKNKCRGMIVTSSSSRVFCAGLDLHELYKPDQLRLREFWSTLQDVWLKIYSSSFPTVAAINGHAPGFGSILAASCEYRVMCSNFTIGMIATKLGIIPPIWFIAPFQDVLTSRNVETAMIEGKVFRTKNALEIGLVDEIAESKEDAIAKSEKFIDRFRGIPPAARAASKHQFRSQHINYLKENKQKDADEFIAHITSQTMQLSLHNYLEDLKNRKTS